MRVGHGLSSMLQSRRPRTGILHLPVELLAIIFSLIYRQLENEEWMAEDYYDNCNPCNFPYNLAAVCPQWDAILARTAEYWKHIVIRVDAVSPTFLSKANELFERSFSLPHITVTITRPDGDLVGTDAVAEGKRTRPIIAMMGPHVHRCTSIIFRVVHGSSLPSIPRDLRAVSPELEILILACKFDNGLPRHLQGSNFQQYSSNLHHCSNLLKVSLHGHTILGILDRQFLSPSDMSAISVLELANFHSGFYAQENFTATVYEDLPQRMALVMGICDSCHLTNIHLPLVPRDKLVATIEPIAGGDIYLKDLGSPFFTHLMACVNFEGTNLKIDGCSFRIQDRSPFIHGSFAMVQSLTLHNITEFLLPWLALSTSQGTTITLGSCSALTDDVLFSANPVMQSGATSNAQSLTIRECNNFSLAAFKSFVVKRPWRDVLVTDHRYRMSENEIAELTELMRGAQGFGTFSFGESSPGTRST